MPDVEIFYFNQFINFIKNKMNNYLFTSESVSEGHPDKVADPMSRPDTCDIIGRVVSIEVAPPADIGARRPKIVASTGAPRRVMISRNILESNAIVPSSAPRLLGSVFSDLFLHIITKRNEC